MSLSSRIQRGICLHEQSQNILFGVQLPPFIPPTTRHFLTFLLQAEQGNCFFFFFFFPFFNGCSFSDLWVVGEGDVISTANTARASLGMRGSFRMEIGPCQPSCVCVPMTKHSLFKTWLFFSLDPCCSQASCSPLSWQPLTSAAPRKRKSHPARGETKPEQPLELGQTQTHVLTALGSPPSAQGPRGDPTAIVFPLKYSLCFLTALQPCLRRVCSTRTPKIEICPPFCPSLGQKRPLAAPLHIPSQSMTATRTKRCPKHHMV